MNPDRFELVIKEGVLILKEQTRSCTGCGGEGGKRHAGTKGRRVQGSGFPDTRRDSGGRAGISQ